MSSSNQQPVVADIVTVFETTQNQSWSIFNDKLNSVSNKNSKKKDPVKSENSITLTSDDVPVFGLVPRLDKVMLVSCNECAMIVKRDCIHSHFYRRHNSNNVSHSEADKFSLVNFLSTVKTNKNKKLKMTVRKPEKKINEREKVNTVVKEIKTEFDQIEYERLLEINRAKIKEENTTEYVDQHNVDMVTTSCNPNTSSGNFDWDVKPCIKSETQCTDHKVNEEIIEHKDFNKLSTVSLDNKKDLQSNKYLDIQNTEHVVNYVTSSNRLLKLDRNKKMKPNVTIDFSGFMYGDEEEYYEKYHKCKNKYQKRPHKIKNIKEKSKLTIKNEYSDIMDNKNYNDISTFYNQSSNTSAVDVKIEYYKLFSGLQNDCEQTKLFVCNKYLDVKNEIPSDSYSTSYHQPTESPKEEFKNIPNNIYPDIKIKEEYDENNDKYKVELCSSDNNNFEVISNTCSGNVDSNPLTTFPCSSVSVKEEVTITESSENIMNNESSDDTVVSNNQSSIAILDINEVSKPLLIPTNTIEESKSSLNIDLNNEKSKHSLPTNYITDNSYTEYYQLYTNSIPQLSPSYKYLDDNNLQDEDNLNNPLNLQVEEDLNDKLNYQEKDHFNDELNLQRKNNLSDELSLQVKEDLNDELYLQDEEDLNNELFLDVKDFIDEIDLQPVGDLTEKINWQSDDDLDNELNLQGEENLNVEFNLQGEGESSMDLDYQDEDNLRDELNQQSVNNFDIKFSMLNEDDLSNREDLNDEKNLSSKENLSSVDVKINDNLKYDCLMPSSQLQNNEEEAKQIPNKECSVIINNESSNVTFTGHDQSSTVTLDNESENNSIIDDAYVVVDNDGIIDKFENQYYRLSPELFDHDAQTSFTPTYKYSDVISNESSDNSDESVSIHDQSSIESLDVRDQTDNSSTENSSDFMSEENLYDSDSTIGSSNQSTELYDIMKKPKYTQTNFLEDHEQFMDRISEKLAKSFGSKVGKNNCTHTNAPLECMSCCKTSEDFIDTSGTQIDEHSVPINSNIQIDKYNANNFTPISSSAQIINNTIIPKDVEEYELKDNNDCDCNVSNKSHYLSHFHPYPCNTASQNNNLMHSPINENDCKVYSSEHYKSNEHILYGNTINEVKPFIDKNKEIYKEFMKIVDNSIPERKCKIMPYTRIVKNLKRKLKRRVADDKENCNHLISRGFKKFKIEFIDRDISCSDESDNNDNVDD